MTEVFSRTVVALGMMCLTAMNIGSEPTIELLDQEYGFGGVRFGAVDTQVPQLVHAPSGVGKRWRNTKLFVRQGDTCKLAGFAVAPTYWFRNHRFIGATIDVPLVQAGEVMAALNKKYGPAQRDTAAADTYYWLGKRTYILFEHFYPKARTWDLHIGSLAMLNEQVMETTVRRQARATLGWQPDSLGLPRQFPR
jgi:hypothetical protein